MLAICVPTYNQIIGDLINELLTQSKKCAVPIEIIVLDDGSSEEFKVINRTSAFTQEIHYEELTQNIGRAAIRNRFLAHTKQTYLLFLDCDSLIDSTTFLDNYIDVIQRLEPSVICGGRTYPTQSEKTKNSFRWNYGVYRECRDEISRTHEPFTSFLTNNFVIKREVLEQLKFDERLTGYGHEDTLFGIALERNGINILHINNPVLNGFIEDNHTFINQTKESIANLIRVEQLYPNEALLKKRIKLLDASAKVAVFAPLFRLLFLLIKKPIERRILSGNLPLKAFDLYKLSYYFTLKKGSQL